MQISPTASSMPGSGPVRTTDLANAAERMRDVLNFRSEAPEMQSDQDYTAEKIARGADPADVMGIVVGDDLSNRGASAEIKEDLRQAARRAAAGYESASRAFTGDLTRQIATNLRETIAEKAIATAFGR